MSFLKSYLGYGGSQASNEKEAVRALPASWYTSQEMYELERRAIFSKKWLFTTHKARIPDSGDWLRYEVAGFEFVICKDNKGKINAFHNVCRHRAFPIVTEEQGHSLVFSCKYHGWSYGLSGNLAKAPGYQDLPGFDKTKNSLLPIHVRVDRNGFIWVNMDGKETPEVSWEQDFAGVDEQPRFDKYTFDDYVFDHSWEMEGPYNWKILADNYNECYHCKTSHPDIPAIADLSSYYGPQLSIMKYEVFRNKNSSDEDFNIISDMYKRIMSEDKYLCSNAQKNLDIGVFVNGEMHPTMEQGPLYFQKLVREIVTEHHQRETKADCEIWPSRQTLPNAANSAVSEKDVNFCSRVDCCSKTPNKEALAF
ncbi:Rieske 2Fe-2S [Geosmithia morbida]|uniref:Choline monooxygenase, chloroplastic n=1 Tax=Geosmithia morbida TaxID=1094350 RepID=A0A9P4YVB0_9HYPO|nr:Rieske 2Fe-2S [Geosmithia morbida]KAF4122454.1 Rieske 2Fe-2S [Geosmithia morbida]